MKLLPTRYETDILDRIKLSGKPLYGTFPWEIQWLINKFSYYKGAIVEIGTFRGSTARELALAFPNRQIICVDCCDPAYGLKPEEICAECKDFPNVKLERIDSRFFQYPNGVDCIFIDGDHTWEGVKADTEKAMSYMRNRSPGVVTWHDYNHEFEVMPYLDWMIDHGITNLRAVQCTQLAHRDF